ncbi:DNA methyltransferase [Kingella kingae]|uniref:DNA methyltransferase n=3 Tax=Kingella kingae TaxID=504 RepID=UPI002550646E|nr:site-specific DNA-methyltransferase [Kingella kingae]MDK4545013.1 site-specific DNA-methyltransferase [Kingella kingae]MDK4567106.1 site-specific DNA-methyltransferase [Kingella kingae]MDK4695486.1 site-specific DNA-methyltransferase [Kingella kingae]
MNTDIQTELTQALLSHEKVWANEEKTILAKNILLDLVEKTDPTIIGLLLGNDELKHHFFVEVNGVLVFKLQDFRFFLDKHSINNSYTKYANRIGLTDGNHFLKDNSDIVLDFPFKDCVLNGGQSTEEGEEIYFKRNNDQSDSQLYTKLTRKRQEIFFNQTLAFDEIDRLFDAKAFSKFSRYTADGKQAVGEIKRHSDGTPAENLIIKGNNLIALHSLAKQFKDKVKLIYIDPPYNTGNDGFKYNDKFNHSSWLVFMKNRLEVAKELLSDDGVIFVQIDDNEQAYLKVLMDEIFGRENFIGTIPRLTSAQRPSQEKYFSISHDYLICYAFNKNYTFNAIIERDFSQEIFQDEIGKFFKNDTSPILASATQGYSKGGDYDIEVNGKIYQPVDSKGNRRRWLWTKERMEKAIELGIVVETKTTLRVRNYIDKEFAVKTNTMIDKNPNLSMTTYDLMNSNYVNNIGTSELTKLEINGFSFPKPEKLIKRIIELTTKPNDIVLDFHLGSGTTAAVAHKMNRQYIGIEQMDYIETLAVQRLKKVIDGEQGGISKAVNWQGGGEFVYAELAPFNETAKQQILACESAGCLKALFEDLCEHYFLKYNVSVNEFSQIIEEPEFQSLPLDEQKQMVLEMLDLNQMYVSLSEMDDEQFAGCLNNDDKALSRAFYQSVKNQAEKKDGE